MSGRFKNQVVIVTGGASGIGLATALRFAEEGAITIIVDKNADLKAQIESSFKEKGLWCDYRQMDVTQEEQVQQLIESVIEDYEKIDVLINNAGIEIAGPMIDFTESQYQQLMDTNVKSVFLCSKYALRPMIQRAMGVIINLASVASFLAWKNDALYSASKAAVKLLTQAMAVEYAPHHIRINAVAPGIIDTPMTDRSIGDAANAMEIKQLKGKIHPLGRLGLPHEVAQAILFLASDEANFITGTTLAVDGGFLAG